MPQYQNGGQQQQQQEQMMQLIQIFAQQNNLDPKQVIQALQSGKLTIEQIQQALSQQEAPQQEMEQEGMEQEEMGQPQPQMMYGGVPRYEMGGSRYMYQNGGKINPTDPSTYPTRNMEEPTFFRQEVRRQSMQPAKKPIQSSMQNPRNPKDFYDQSYINYINNLGKPSNQNQYNTIQRSSYRPATPMMQYITLPRYGVGGTAIDFSAVPQSPVNLVGPRMEDNRFISNNGLQLAGNRAQMSTLGPNNSRMTVGNPETEMNTPEYNNLAVKTTNSIPTSGGRKEFELAFDANRRSGAKVFPFNNKLYNTNLASNNTKPIAKISQNGKVTPIVKSASKVKANPTNTNTNTKNTVDPGINGARFAMQNMKKSFQPTISSRTPMNSAVVRPGSTYQEIAGPFIGAFGDRKLNAAAYKNYNKNKDNSSPKAYAKASAVMGSVVAAAMLAPEVLAGMGPMAIPFMTKYYPYVQKAVTNSKLLQSGQTGQKLLNSGQKMLQSPQLKGYMGKMPFKFGGMFKNKK
jgi:hypothetical protein